jgi:glycosyltransferase involved in cell wall biosynthesis
LVVDDGSDPACVAAVRAYIAGENHPFVSHIELPHNRGAGAARNAGALKSRGSILAFLDDDIVPAEDYVRAVIEAHERHPDALVINGNLRAMRQDIYSDFWFYYYSAVFNRPGEEFFPVRMLASGHFTIKRSVMACENPLFDPSLTSREDFDLYLRLRKRGIRSYKDDRILAFIDTRSTLVGFLKQRLWYGRGQEQLIAKHGTTVLLQAQTIVPLNLRHAHLHMLVRLTRTVVRIFRRRSARRAHDPR